MVLHLAAARRIEVSGQRPLVPGARRVGIPRVPVEVADRLGQLGPPGPEGGALVERDRLVDAALRGSQLGDVLVDDPVAGVRSLGSLVVMLRGGEAAVTQVQEAPLHLDPGVLAELLGGDLVGGLGVERVGPVGVAQRPFEVRQPRKIRPRMGLGDQSLAGATRLPIAAELEVDVGLDRAAVGRAGEPLAQREARDRVVEPVLLQMDAGAQEAQVGPRAEPLERRIERGGGPAHLVEVARERRPVHAAGGEAGRVLSVRGPRALELRDLGREPVEVAGVIRCEGGGASTRHEARRGRGTRSGTRGRSEAGWAASSEGSAPRPRAPGRSGRRGGTDGR